MPMVLQFAVVFASCERKLKADELLQLSILSLAKIILPSTRGYADYQSAATCSKAKKRDLTSFRPRAIARMESPAWPGRQAADGEAAVNQGYSSYLANFCIPETITRATDCGCSWDVGV